MKKRVFIAVCCLVTGVISAQDNKDVASGTTPGERRGGWHILGETYAMHDADHDVIEIKNPVANFKKLKVTVRDAPLTIMRMTVVYDSGEEETIDAPMAIPKNGESATLPIKTGTRNIKRIDFWYDSADFVKGKAEVTVFARK